MRCITVYQCLCDETRLRILNVLMEGPLCVCHLAEILELDQPKVSRHLKSLKASGAVETTRCYNWTICRIAKTPGRVLAANLSCLQDLQGEERIFKRDMERRRAMLATIAGSDCGQLPGQIRNLCESVSMGEGAGA